MSTNLLQGYRVLDLSQYIPGPFATKLLADLGADVIKIEPPHGDPMRQFMYEGDSELSPIYKHLNRGKRVILLDLKSDHGQDKLAELIADADVLLESFRPGVMAKLGFDRERLNELNPTLVHCALSGFGQNGPYKFQAGHDLTYCAASGALSASGTEERPVMTFPPLADHAGAMQACNSILAGLLSRNRSNEGVFLDISLHESALSWQYLTLIADNPQREQELLNGGAACYNIYETADHQFIALAPLEPKFWQAFCEAVNKPEWLKRHFEPLPQTDLIKEISALFANQPLDFWNTLFEGVDCCYEPILPASEISNHPQVKARGLLSGDEPHYQAWINGTAMPLSPDVEFADDVKWKA